MVDLMSYCNRCGNCCRNPEAVYLNASDLIRLTRLYKSAKEAKQFVKFQKGRWQLKKVQPCQYLINRNECLIYEDRPQACRNFPLEDDGQGGAVFIQLPYCHLAQNLPPNAQFKVEVQQI